MKFIDSIRASIAKHQHFSAMEFFPPKTRPALANLYQRMERMTSAEPAICAITWADDDSSAEESMAIAEHAQSLLSLDVQVNITGYGSSEAQMRGWLLELKRRNIHNLCLLRGSRQHVPQEGGVVFEHGVDLVRFVRKEFGDYFGISVAGHPEGHPEDTSYEASLLHLKEKVDAGADVIITQMIFDVDIFVKYCEDCRRVGITCPIVPGIMPIYSYTQFKRTCCAVASAGTAAADEKLQAVRNDDAEVKRVGIDIIQALLKGLYRKGVRGVYFYTTNMEALVLEILNGIDAEATRRDLPWRQSCDANRRSKEHVRPIHWAARSKSYLHLTSSWDEFPNGRWGNTKSPAFREDATYHAAMVLEATSRQCPAFRTIATREDICRVFLGFLDGAAVLPWSDDLSAEADILMESTLKPLNARSLLTINSQPAINGAPSANAYVGWGPLGGYVYQKSYLEFFCPPEYAQLVFSTLERHASLAYMATDARGTMTRCSPLFEKEQATAVTWGVFPGQEVQQPTIVSRESFQTWAPEAFSLWAAPFKSGGGADGDLPVVITTIQATWLLVTVVDNEFTLRPSPLDAAVRSLCDCVPVVAHSPLSPACQRRGYAARRHMPHEEIEAILSLRSAPRSLSTTAATTAA